MLRTPLSVTVLPRTSPVAVRATSSAQERSLEGLSACHHSSTAQKASANSPGAASAWPRHVAARSTTVNTAHRLIMATRASAPPGAWNHSATVTQAASRTMRPEARIKSVVRMCAAPTTEAWQSSSLAGRLLWVAPRGVPDALRIVLDQGLAYDQKAHRVVLERRAGRVVAEAGVGAQVDHGERGQDPAREPAVEVEYIDAVVDAIVDDEAAGVAHVRWTQERRHQVRSRPHAPARHGLRKAGAHP